jgi:NADPH-ferrihemoprotein reductase
MNYEEDLVVTPTSQVFLMLIATHGEGEPTDSCKAFHTYLKDLSNNNKNSNTYKGMQLSVFGLGKSSYEHYNAMAKFFRDHLGRHGAQVLHPHAEGDDMGSLEDDFTDWKQHLSNAIKQHLLT